MLELASGALDELDDAVARALTPPHQRASLTQITNATEMVGGDDMNPEIARNTKLSGTEPRRERVNVEDIGSEALEVMVKRFGAPYLHAGLGLGARGAHGDRISEHWKPIMLSLFGGTETGKRCGDLDIVSERPLSRREPGHIDFRAAEALGKVPAEGVKDFHRFR